MTSRPEPAAERTESISGPETTPISTIGWLRVVWRAVAILALLVACAVPGTISRRFGHAGPWPRLFLSGLARLCGLRLAICGTKAPGRVLLLANHVSWLDIPAIAAVTGSAFVAHDGLAGVPLLKHLCALNDTVFVARHDRTSVGAQVADIRTALADLGALTVFPEGTTSDGTGLLPFKSSLLAALLPLPEGLTVQPVALDYGPDSASIAWIGRETGTANFLRILARRQPLELTLRFLGPLTGEQLTSRKTMAAAAQGAVLAGLKRG